MNSPGDVFGLERISDLNILALRSKMDKKALFLKNTMRPPYKKPRLPFGEKSAKVHRPLQSLKIAHAWMVMSIVNIQEHLPDELLLCSLIYTPELYFGSVGYPPGVWKEYLKADSDVPWLVSGFYVRDVALRKLSAFSFDLSPLAPFEKGLSFSETGLSSSDVKTLGYAADFYNGCVDDLHTNGFFVFPKVFVDAFDGLHFFPLTPGGSLLAEI
ncbi:MAG: hypothetical protein RBT11_01790 [Desulfobacterales bacterium]|jgi:hypothetical protein|nr:hypothetical protein [Desulfobacterales bacterium]